MTDPTPRAAWTRCNACQQKVENNRHEIDIHKLICPHRLQLQIQDLASRVKKLEGELESIDEQLAGDLDVDPTAVAPWPDDDEDPDELPADTDPGRGDAHDGYPAGFDDEDELPVRPTSLYSPGPGPIA